MLGLAITVVGFPLGTVFLQIVRTGAYGPLVGRFGTGLFLLAYSVIYDQPRKRA